MTITLHCSCGKTLAVAEQYRGKKAKCPGCGNVLTVADPLEEVEVDLGAAVQADSPAKRVALQEEDADMPEVRKPLRRPSDVKRSWIPLLIAGGILFMLMFGFFLCAGAMFLFG